MAKKQYSVEGGKQETAFQEYFKKKVRVNSLILLQTEVRLYPPFTLLSRDFYTTDEAVKKIERRNCIGRIDVLFRYKGTLFAGEIKYMLPRNSFWEALKVIGYVAYYNWQNEISNAYEYAKPALLIPHKHIRLEHKIVANKLDLLLFGITKLPNGEYSIQAENR